MTRHRWERVFPTSRASSNGQMALGIRYIVGQAALAFMIWKVRNPGIEVGIAWC